MSDNTEDDTDPQAPVDLAEVGDLRRRVRELEEAVRRLGEAPRVGRSGRFRAFKSWRASIALAALLVALAGGSVVVADTGLQGLFVDEAGNVGIGTAEPGGNKLRVNGTVEVGGTNPIRFSSNWSDFSGLIAGHKTNTAEISNDTGTYKALMVVGNSSAQADRRQVNIYDDLTLPNGSVTAKKINIAGDATVEGKLKNSLSVAGPVKIDGNNVLEFGVGVKQNDTDKQADAGKIGYQKFSGDALDIVGAGTDGTNRKIKFWAEGGATFTGVVDGNMKVIYQRDDEPQTTYQKPLWRYHMSLTAAKYGGKTKTIPKDILTALCGKSDGCEVRLGMTRWDNANQTETASIVNRFYYSPADGRWRTNNATDKIGQGVIGNGRREDAMDAFGTCYFTDATWENYQERGELGTGMQLLVWNGYKTPARTCELTIIP